MISSHRSKIIAICGIDGSGKSTVIAELREDAAFRDACFLKKDDKDNFSRVIELNKPIGPMPRAYLEGALATAIRWAHAFDYLRYYETTVRPLTRRSSLIVSDRWSFCPIAFAGVGTALVGEISFLLRHVDEPDLTIFLDVEPDLAFARLEARGPVLDDEHVDLLHAYRTAYKDFFASYSGPFVRIASTTREQTYAEVRKAINRALSL